MDKILNNFDIAFNNNFSWVRDNIYVKTTIILFLAAYPALARPKLPLYLERMFENTFVRFVLISYVIYEIEVVKDIQISVIISLIFLLIMHNINKTKINRDIEKMSNVINLVNN